ncbi:MAG: hypothetical protein BroJett040_20640 [Oligoflexia bacterium]|nr:MAG: hypothetical protein BroJett040_20640 [Oligoflexia bacterium]
MLMYMRKILNAWLMIALIGISSWSHFAQAQDFYTLTLSLNEKEQGILQSYSGFLARMGFENYSLQAYQNMLRVQSGSQSNREKEFILKRNTQRFEFLNDVHDLVALLMVKLESHPDNRNQAIEQLISMTVFALRQFPLMGLEPVKEDVLGNVFGPKAEEIREKYLLAKAQKRYREEKAILMSMAMKVILPSMDPEVIDSEKDLISKIDKLISQSISYQYEYAGLQQNRYLGKALAVALMRYAHLHDDISLKALLKVRCLDAGIDLDNYISDTLSFQSSEGMTKKVQVRSGDLAVEMSVDALSFAISVGTNPTNPQDLKLAQSLDILNSPILAPHFISNSPYQELVTKRKSNIELTEQEERVMQVLWDPKNLKGFSHAALVDVRRDQETGLSTVWIWDIYPDRNRAGMRIMTADAFAYPEKYHRIGFVRYSSVKLLQSLKRQIAKRGYLDFVWSSYQTELTKDNGYVLNRSQRYQWPSRVDRKTVSRWVNLSDQKAEDWYSYELAPRLMKLVKSYFVGQDALAYSQDFLNGASMAYCSQMPLLAYLQAGNLDLQESPEEWGKMARFAKTIGAIRYDLSERIISPNGLVWQSGIVEKVFITEFAQERVIGQKLHHPLTTQRMTVADARIEHGKMSADQNLFQALLGSSYLKDIDQVDIDIDDDEF